MPARVPYTTPLKAGQKLYWCSCGLSQKQPYCDGSHRGTEHEPMLVDPKETVTVAFCGCKLTKKPPYCDGSHIALRDKEKSAGG
jgi:CDGSH-type Zn-finger protein